MQQYDINLATFEKIAMVLLNDNLKDKIPTENDIIDIANKTRIICPISDDCFEQVIKNLHSKLQVTMDKGVFIKNKTHYPWLNSRRAEIVFYYWTRYKEYLEEEKGWNSKVIATLDNVTDEILDLLGNPKEKGVWHRSGLILGDIQSGKTANYTALINKAADAGYKVIILLTGTLENLRRQTQSRLDSDFVGIRSKDALKKDIQTIYEGVGKIDAKRRAMVFTSVQNDFNAVLLNNLGLNLKDCKEPALFVVKKNKKILDNLDTWLRLNNANSQGLIDIPMLLIDDEADYASVNTHQDDNPTAINEGIRSLLNRFCRTTYVGVTATPFANIFINPDTYDEMIGDDLFPRDFIYSLSAPSNYIGSNAIFGDEPTHDHSLIEINDAESFFPSKHKSTYTVKAIPNSLIEALNYFILSNAVRDYRGQQATHRSMLINISRFTNVQNQVAEIIKLWLQRVKNDVKCYCKLEKQEACKNNTINNLYNTWVKYELSNICKVDWERIQKDFLVEAVMPIEVRSINQSSGAASLDYEKYKETGLRIITVGGNSLSRGLTLEGLCVSYFYRNSQMYDTLMQMGRWFGYREGYDDIIKIWMTEEAIKWYEYITMATNELRSEIRQMNRLGLTPEDFGLKVREDPDSLIVTAKNKMRNAQTWECWVSVSGRLIETPRLSSKPGIIKANEKAYEGFINQVINEGKKVESIKRNELLWMDVPKKCIVQFLRNFTTHQWHMAFHSNELADFIENSNHLETWDVVIPGGTGDREDIGKWSINKEKRKICSANDDAILISGHKVRVGSLGCTKSALSDEEIRKAEEKFRNQNPDKAKSAVPDNAYLIANRKPLLILHIIQPIESKNEPGLLFKIGTNKLIALGVGFPKFNDEDESKKARYKLNLVEIRNWFMSEEEDDYDVND